MSRIPIAAAAPAAAPAYRAAMLRGGAASALPAAAPKRPQAAKPKAAQIARKARPLRKASLNRSARKVRAARRTVAVPAPWVAPARAAPTPMAAAARELATPLSYALISTIICEIGPPLPVAPGGEIEPETAPDDGLVVFPPELLQPGPEVFFPPAPALFPEDKLIILTPPPPDKPLVERPQTLQPPVKPPVGPPQTPQLPFNPPVGPLQPFVPTAIPEPATWALMILGFGLLGARLRAISSAGRGARFRGRSA
jgi:hypothetical protein